MLPLPRSCLTYVTGLAQNYPRHRVRRSKRRAAGAFFMRASESKTYYKVDIVSNTK